MAAMGRLSGPLVALAAAFTLAAGPVFAEDMAPAPVAAIV